MMPFSELNVDLQFLFIHTPCRSALDRYLCCTCVVFHLDYSSVRVCVCVLLVPGLTQRWIATGKLLAAGAEKCPLYGSGGGGVYRALLVSD